MAAQPSQPLPTPPGSAYGQHQHPPQSQHPYRPSPQDDGPYDSSSSAYQPPLHHHHQPSDHDPYRQQNTQRHQHYYQAQPQHQLAHQQQQLQSQPQQQQQQQRPDLAALTPVQSPASTRRSLQSPRQKNRTFSFQSGRSHKSAESAGGHSKVDLHESAAEKEAKRLHSKADPTMALSELEPGQMASSEKASLASIRAIQHLGDDGKPITDPDLSNPTRSRAERPLDTIRKYEALIDGTYSRRSTMLYRTESASMHNNSRRNSYYSANGGGAARYARDSYYGSRLGPPRPDYGQHDSRQGGGYYEQQGHHPQQYAPRQRYSRTATEPGMPYYSHGEPGGYHMPSNHRSYETVASGSGSGTSGEAMGYSTDPTSSENSSIDRQTAMAARRTHTEPVGDYGIDFGQNPAASYQAPHFVPGGKPPPMAQPYSNGGSGGGGGGIPPPPQSHQQPDNGYAMSNAMPAVQRPSGPVAKLQRTATTDSRSSSGEKTKSWFKKRFSKHG